MTSTERARPCCAMCDPFERCPRLALEARVKTLERNYRSGEGALYDRVAALEDAVQASPEDFAQAVRDAIVDRARGRREP